MVVLPVVALIAAISPMCSIMVARAMGTMVNTALMKVSLPSMANRPMLSLWMGMPNQAAAPMAW